jgi:transposase
MRCGFNVINRVIHASTTRGLLRRDYASFKFKHLSIDEKSFRKGHQYVSVLSHPASGCVMDIVEGRTKEATKNLLDSTLTKEQQEAVQTISMDMWKAYIYTTKEKLPNAEIVHDRFHLVKYLNGAIDKVRRREVKTQDELKDSRYALLKNKANLTEKQRLKFEAIQKANYEVGKAWQVRENFRDMIFKETKKENSFMLFMKWARDATNKKIKEVDKVVNMFQDHLGGVVNALIYTFNNAMAERLNGKIQELKSVGRGYRTFKNFRSAVLFFHGGLSIYPLK